MLATWNEEAVCLTPATQTGPSGRPRVAFAPGQRHVALANAQGPEPRALHPLFPPRRPAAQGEAPPPRAHRASHVTVHAGVRQARPGGDDGGGGGGAAGWAAPTRAPQGSPCRMWGGSLGVARGARPGRPAGSAVPGAGVSTPSDVQGTLMVAVARGGPHLSAPAGGVPPQEIRLRVSARQLQKWERTGEARVPCHCEWSPCFCGDRHLAPSTAWLSADSR